MLIQNASYTLIDSSILARLTDSNQIDTLNSSNFISHYGFPFITLHNFLELAGIQSKIDFKKRIVKIFSLENIAFLNYRDIQIPGSTIDLLCFELEAISKLNLTSQDQIKNYIISKIKLCHHRLTDIDIDYIYEKAGDEKFKSGFISAMNRRLANPHYDFTIKELKQFKMDFSNTSKIDPFACELQELFKTRGIEIDKNEKIIAFFKEQTELTRNQFLGISSAIEFIEQIAEEKLDDEKTLGYYLDRIVYKEQLKNISTIISVPYSELIEIDISNTYAMHLSHLLKDEIELEIIRDSRRKIELSNTDDIYLATFSPYMKTLVDKRTYSTLMNCQKKIKYKLDFERTNYKILN